MRVLVSLFVLVFTVLSCSSCGGDQTMPADPFEVEKDKARDKQVRDNLRTTQRAAERFAADHGNVNYPVEVDDMFKTYFPGGKEGRIAAQVGMVNPFNGANEFPVIGKTTAKDAEELRHMKRFELGKGVVEFIPLEGGHSYAIVGGAHDGKVMMDELHPDQILVFSNI